MSTQVEFRLPDVGEGIAQAEVVAWHVREGEQVSEHQELVEVETDKAVVTIPCPTAGTVVKLCATPGQVLDVGAVLAVFASDGNRDAPSPHGAAASVAHEATAAQSGVSTDGAAGSAGSSTPSTPSTRPLAAPATRRLARSLGVALEGVRGSGPHGRIVREDVERAAAPPPPTPAASRQTPPSSGRPDADEVIPLRGVRRAIAHSLTDAWHEVPRVIDYREVDATELLRARSLLRERARQRGAEALAAAMSPTPLIVRAAVRALRDHPYVNASIDLEREQITLHRHHHIGIATATPDGLIVPVLHDADRLSLSATALAVAELSAAARERRLTPGQLSGATFTVNNYGGLGIWLGTPIVRPPEVANLGVGAIRDQVVAVAGQPVVRPTLALAVAGDHRILDGHTLAAFVTQVLELLEEPLLLLDDGG